MVCERGGGGEDFCWARALKRRGWNIALRVKSFPPLNLNQERGCLR